MTSFVLLLIGWLLIFLEFFLPGGILGTLGGAIVVLSMIVAAGSSSALFTIGFAILAGIGVWLIIRFALHRITHSSSLYSGEDQQGFVASDVDQAVVDQEGVALTDLKPSGHVEVLGNRYQAVSQSGYINQGTKIIVTGGQGAHVTCRVKGDG